MKVGDLVKWIGFPGATVPPETTGPSEVGIIIDIYVLGKPNSGDQRIDVMWGGGYVGKMLYPQTIEVLYEDR